MHLPDARTRARQAAERVAKDGGGDHVVKALLESESQLAELHRNLSQGTYYTVVDDALRLAV